MPGCQLWLSVLGVELLIGGLRVSTAVCPGQIVLMIWTANWECEDHNVSYYCQHKPMLMTNFVLILFSYVSMDYKAQKNGVHGH